MNNTLNANQSATFNFLNDRFQTTENGVWEIDQSYFYETVYDRIMNTEHFYTALTSSRRSVQSIIWEAIVDLCNDTLKHNGVCTNSEYVEEWFQHYWFDYGTFLVGLVEDLTEIREDAIE